MPAAGAAPSNAWSPSGSTRLARFQRMAKRETFGAISTATSFGSTPARARQLLLRVIAYNLGNLLRRLVLPLAIQSWSRPSLQQRLFPKTGGAPRPHARYFILQLAESHLTRRLFGQILRRIERLTWHTT